MFWHPIILTQQKSPVGWSHYKSSRTGGRDDLPQRVLARTCSSFKSLARLSSRIYNYTRFFLRRKQRPLLINFSFRKASFVFFFLFSLTKPDNCVILRKQTDALDQISPMWRADQISSKFRTFLPSSLFFWKVFNW